MNERLETLKKARSRMIEDRDAHAKVLAAPFDRDKAERARGKFTEIQALIDAESPAGERRARMIASFNRGYRGFQQTYRTCTPAADLVIRRYLEEGSKIAREVTARYANYRIVQCVSRDTCCN